MYHEWDWPAAEREFKTAMALNPGYATARQWYGNFLSVMGRADESLAEFSNAIALDPLSPLRLAALGWSYFFARDYQKAIAECRRALQLDAEFIVARCWRCGRGRDLARAGGIRPAPIRWSSSGSTRGWILSGRHPGFSACSPE